MVELKECPDCGGAAMFTHMKTLHEDFSYDLSYRARCIFCDAETEEFGTMERAAEAWNSRPRTMGKDQKNYHDAHYQGNVQPIELMMEQFTPEEFTGYLKGNIIKYASRLGKKDDAKKEADKLARYAEWLKQFVYTGKIELEKV